MTRFNCTWIESHDMRDEILQMRLIHVCVATVQVKGSYSFCCTQHKNEIIAPALFSGLVTKQWRHMRSHKLHTKQAKWRALKSSDMNKRTTLQNNTSQASQSKKHWQTNRQPKHFLHLGCSNMSCYSFYDSTMMQCDVNKVQVNYMRWRSMNTSDMSMILSDTIQRHTVLASNQWETQLKLLNHLEPQFCLKTCFEFQRTWRLLPFITKLENLCLTSNIGHNTKIRWN